MSAKADCRNCDGFKNVEVWIDERTYRVEKCKTCNGTGADPWPEDFAFAETKEGGA